MGAKTNYAENQFIDVFIRNQTKPTLTDWYIGLAISSAGKHAVSTAFALDDTVFITDDSGKWRLYKCTTAGTTAGTKPSYPGVHNEVITDGTAEFTEQHAGLEAGTAIVEPSGNGYARVQVAASLAAWAGTQGAGTTTASSGTGGTTSNNGAVTFPDPTDDWGWCGLFVFFDALTSGNAWLYGALDNPLFLTAGLTNITFAAAALQYTEDN